MAFAAADADGDAAGGTGYALTPDGDGTRPKTGRFSRNAAADPGHRRGLLSLSSGVTRPPGGSRSRNRRRSTTLVD